MQTVKYKNQNLVTCSSYFTGRTLVHDAVMFTEGACSLAQHSIGGLFLYQACLNRRNEHTLSIPPVENDYLPYQRYHQRYNDGTFV